MLMTSIDPLKTDAHVADNVAIYSLKGIAPHYAQEPLHPPEIHIFIKHKAEFEGRTVLDIGVGTGRTSKYLAPFAKRYVGIDLSRDMLAHFSGQLPNTELIHCDMRNFAALNTDVFDFVLGPYSAFDSLKHSDRVQMFRDIHAMTSLGAMFAFSTHNLNWTGIGNTPELERSRDPVRMLRNVVAWRLYVRNHRSKKPFEERHAEYAILNDISHQWLALLYYITRENQVKQLSATGFEVMEVYDREGRILPAGADDSHCAVMYYVCRRV